VGCNVTKEINKKDCNINITIEFNIYKKKCEAIYEFNTVSVCSAVSIKYCLVTTVFVLFA
jgi:hypothetical protein